MAEAADFRLRHGKAPTTGRDELWATIDYEGPFGPLRVETGDGGCLELTGPAVGKATLCIPPADGPAAGMRGADSGPGATADLSRLGPTLQGHLRRGIDLRVGEVEVRLHQPKRGLTRSSRALLVERTGRTTILRNRGAATLSMETPDGTRLLQRTAYNRGRVWPTAEAVDVAVFLLVNASGLGVAVDL